MSTRLAGRPSSTAVIYYLAHALLIAIGSAVTLVGGTIWTAIGTSLIATGAAGAVIYLYLSYTETTHKLIEVLREFGLEMAYDRRAAQIRSEYASRLSKATANIDILGFGLKDFRRDYIAELGALSSKAKIRILMMDPDTELPSQRDAEEGQSAGTIASEIREFATQYQQLYGANPPPGLSIRYFTCLPSVNIFRIDNDIFWGPYFVGRASGNTVTLRVRRGGIMYDQLLQHFEELWTNHSRPLTDRP